MQIGKCVGAHVWSVINFIMMYINLNKFCICIWLVFYESNSVLLNFKLIGHGIVKGWEKGLGDGNLMDKD